MPDPSIRYKSTLPYHVLLFVTLIVWVFIAQDLSQRFLSTIYTAPLTWIVVSAGIFLIPLIPASIVTHGLKNAVEFEPPSWNIQVREIPYAEFERMMKEYLGAYAPLISRVHVTDIILAGSLFGIGVSFPLLFSYGVLLVFFTPYIFSAIVLVFGLLLTRILYRLFENNATSEFPYWSPTKFKEALDLLLDTPGISHAGIRLAIGEADGYYTIRDPVAVGRIEGIEGVARIDVVLSRKGKKSEASAFLDIGTQKESKSKSIQFNNGNIDAELLALVRWLLSEYMATSESYDIISDVLEDVGLSPP